MGRERSIGIVSDFGNGPYLGIMKAVIRSLVPEADIIDIDNSVPSYKVLAGAYVLAHSYYWMPRGSVILAVVDPGVGTARKALAVRTRNYYFVGPDNGLLYPAIMRDGVEEIISLEYKKVQAYAADMFRGVLEAGEWKISKTFHGRDVFAPAAAIIASGLHELDSLGKRIGLDEVKKVTIDYVEKHNGGVKVQVVYVDKFGNIALSATPKIIGFRKWSLATVQTSEGNYQAHCGRTFSDVHPAELIIYENSFGHLEIAINQGNAARKLNADVGDKLVIIPVES